MQKYFFDFFYVLFFYLVNFADFTIGLISERIARGGVTARNRNSETTLNVVAPNVAFQDLVNINHKNGLKSIKICHGAAFSREVMQTGRVHTHDIYQGKMTKFLISRFSIFQNKLSIFIIFV